MQVEQIWLHPVKSCRGVSVTEAAFDNHGFVLDRRWLIIDAKTNRFMTARDVAKMVMIETSLSEKELTITVPNDPPENFVIPLYPTQEELDDYELVDGITLFGAKNLDGYAVSSECDQALSLFLGKQVRLVQKGPTLRPPGDDRPFESMDYAEDEAGTQYQDFYPITVCSKASLEQTQDAILSSVQGKRFRVENLDASLWPEERCKVSIQRWRQNLIIGGVEKAWDEDSWLGIEIGQDKHVIYTVARCARCMVPNISEDTGKRDAAIPWSVMQQFRIAEPDNVDKYCFGMNAMPKSKSGVITVGDSVTVMKRTNPATRRSQM